MYKVRLNGSDIVFDVNEKESILDAAVRQGISLSHGCRTGACGSCIGTILNGEIHYLDVFPEIITEHEANQGIAVLCQAYPDSDLRIQATLVDDSSGIQIKKLPVRVESAEKLNHDVLLLKLKLPDSERLQFLAGQYVEILLDDGRRRAFSLANAPHDDTFLTMHVREVSGGYFTQYLFHEMEPKALFRIEGPFGSFFLREDSDKPIVLMAGGTGFGPCKSIIEHAIEVGIERPITLFWGAKAAKDLYLDDLAKSWADQHANITYVPVLSEPEDSDQWDGETGWVHEAVLTQIQDLAAHDVYLCGPPPMIEAGKRTFMERGLPEAQLFSDSFDFSGDTQNKG